MPKAKKILQPNPFERLLHGLQTADEVYRAALYGALHNETQILQVLVKFGHQKSVKALDKVKYEKTVAMLNAIAVNDRKFKFEFQNKDITLIRKALSGQLRFVKNVPSQARDQLIITYATFVESFFADIIRTFYKTYPKSLKSNKTTLKDSQLVEAILEGDPLAKLIDVRFREVMYDSVSGWLTHLNERGMNIPENLELKEMFLIRNVLIHNNRKAGPELLASHNKRKYQLGEEVTIQQRDLNRFRQAIDRTVSQIEVDLSNKVVLIN